ncbi:ABC transporter permease [Cumulibacter soli]|uniref:ABC transporter permease n=1 Tax=Cumulibacter soli TaxID=2546344 RepID=UPI001067250B|nr:ABC transporter permease [Cumulibacter soli]
MLVTLARRVGIAVLTLLAASVIIWSLLLLAPGDPAGGVLRARGILEPDAAQIAAMRAELGLDGNPIGRYLDWLGTALQGDFGVSWRSGRSVMSEFATRLPATLRLTAAALVIGIVMALVIGIASAAAPRRWPDRVGRVVSLALVIAPGFLVGLIILNVLVLQLGLGVIVSDGTWGTVGWPAFTLALGSAGYWARILRASILEAQSSAYMQVCRARGISPTRRMFTHALPNAAGPFLTVVSLGAAGLIGGAPIAESVFTWPGVGGYTMQAINARDQPVIATFTMLAVLIYVIVSLLIDLLLAVIDPRLRGHGLSRRQLRLALRDAARTEQTESRELEVSR